MTFGLGICDDRSIACELAWSVLYAADNLLVPMTIIGVAFIVYGICCFCEGRILP